MDVHLYIYSDVELRAISYSVNSFTKRDFMQAKSFRKLLISCYNTVYKLWTSIKKDYIQYVMQDLVL